MAHAEVGMPDDHAIVDVHAGDDLSPLAGSWEVDPTHSAVEFVARYAVFTLVRGRFTSFAGTVVLDPPHFEATQIDVDIDSASVDSAMEVRDAHLRSQDFFDVERHPVMSFSARGATLLAPGRYTVHGELTIRGITQPVRLDVDAFGCAPDVLGQARLGLRATAKVQRALWGITWNAPVLGGGVALAQEVQLELDVSLVRAGSADWSGAALADRIDAIGASGRARPTKELTDVGATTRSTGSCLPAEGAVAVVAS